MLRSLLFVPGNSTSKMAKAAQLRADAVILDWEDAVLPAEKASARRQTMEFLQRTEVTPFVFIRFNPAGTAAFEEDCKALPACVPRGIVLSKCRGAEDVKRLAGVLDATDAAQRCSICALVESPEGRLNAQKISEASSRVSAIAFGAEDFSAEMEIVRTPEELELLYARSVIATVCRAHGKEAIDSPCLEFRDLARVEATAQRAHNLGFTGKLAIHPAQVAILNSVFSPGEAELEHARRIVELFSAAGSGVAVVDGQMVDEAVGGRARRVIELAAQCSSV